MAPWPPNQNDQLAIQPSQVKTLIQSVLAGLAAAALRNPLTPSATGAVAPPPTPVGSAGAVEHAQSQPAAVPSPGTAKAQTQLHSITLRFVAGEPLSVDTNDIPNPPHITFTGGIKAVK